MVNKIVESLEEAVKDIFDGASIMAIGWAGCPFNLRQAVLDKGVSNLTIITSSFAKAQLGPFLRKGRLRKLISGYPIEGSDKQMNHLILEEIQKGTLDVEVVPYGTLVERIRAGGSGIAGFYTPVGVDTKLAEGKEEKVFGGKKYLLETALTADFALIKGAKADRYGNIVYRRAQKSWNMVIAPAAKITIAEVDQIVPVGELDPDIIHTPGIFVDRVVQVPGRALVFTRRDLHRD